MRAVVACLVLIALLAPSVDGQATATPVITWTAADTTPLVVPVEEPAAFEAVVEVACSTGSPVSPDPWTFDIQARPEHEGVVATVKPATFSVAVEPAACAAGDTIATQAVEIDITAAQDVRAGSRIPLLLTASEASLDEPVATNVTVPIGAYFRHRAQFEQAVFKVPPNGQVDLQLLVTNFGNAEILLSVASGDNTSSDLHIEMPHEMRVAPDEEKRFTVGTEASGANSLYENRRHKVFLDVGAVWSEDAAIQGDTIQLAAVIQEQGSAAAPAPVPVWVLLAVLVLLHLARRRP